MKKKGKITVYKCLLSSLVTVTNIKFKEKTMSMLEVNDFQRISLSLM